MNALVDTPAGEEWPERCCLCWNPIRLVETEWVDTGGFLPTICSEGVPDNAFRHVPL